MKSTYSRPLSGNAATFEALHTGYKLTTLPEFSYSRDLAFEKKVTLLSMTLLRLWVPVKHDEDYSFIPHYPSSTPDQTLLHEQTIRKTTVPFYEYPALTMHKAFSTGYPQNLGAITLLNLLMGSKLDNRSLGIVESELTGSPYFTQRPCDFWCGFFKKQQSPHLLNTRIPFDSQLTGFLQHHHETWWKTALEGESQSSEKSTSLIHSELFTSEIFATALRIYLTPQSVLSRMVDLTLRQTSSAFTTHFFQRITLFKQEFSNILSIKKQAEWSDWLEQSGSMHSDHYIKYLSDFKINSDPLLMNKLSPALLDDIMSAAMELDIPSLHLVFPANKVLFFLPKTKISVLYYLIYQLHDNWAKLASQPNDSLWIYLEALIQHIMPTLKKNNLKFKFSPQLMPFIHLLIVTCNEHKKDLLASFFSSQDSDSVPDESSTPSLK